MASGCPGRGGGGGGRARRGVFGPGDADFFGFGQADEEIAQVEWVEDFLFEELLEGESGGTAGGFADDPAKGDGVVFRAFSGRPSRGEAGDGVTHGAPIAKHGEIGARRYAGKSGCVVERVTQGDGVFAVCGEFRPPCGNGRIVVEDAACGEAMDDGGGGAFAAGEEGEKGVCSDGVDTPGAGVAGVGIHNEFAVVIDGGLQAAFTVFVNELVEEILDLGLGVGHATAGISTARGGQSFAQIPLGFVEIGGVLGDFFAFDEARMAIPIHDVGSAVVAVGRSAGGADFLAVINP